MTGTEPGPAAEPATEAEAPAEPEAPADLLAEIGDLAEEVKGTAAGTPGQRVRLLILAAVVGFMMLLGFAATRSGDTGPAPSPSGEVAGLVL